jgi:hypothetical protein
MKSKHRQAMRTKLRLQDSYVNGVSDDEAALEAQQWHDENVPEYEGNLPDRHIDEMIPF